MCDTRLHQLIPRSPLNNRDALLNLKLYQISLTVRVKLHKVSPLFFVQELAYDARETGS